MILFWSTSRNVSIMNVLCSNILSCWEECLLERQRLGDMRGLYILFCVMAASTSNSSLGKIFSKRLGIIHPSSPPNSLSSSIQFKHGRSLQSPVPKPIQLAWSYARHFTFSQKWWEELVVIKRISMIARIVW